MDTAHNPLSFQRLEKDAEGSIRDLFVSVFTREPWNDDWSDGKQLQQYIQDLTGQGNSLAFGLYEDEELIAVSMGHIKHWYSGTEYCIDELCVSPFKQGRGIGTIFVSEIEKACKKMGFTHLFLLTDDDVPAYSFYKRLGFNELQHNAAFAKRLL